MRTLLRAGAIALAASSALLGSAVAAQAAPAADIRFTVSQLIFEPAATGGHTGELAITIRNTGDEPWAGGFTLTEPLAATFEDVTGTLGCGVESDAAGRQTVGCPLAEEIEPGATAYLTASFRSVAKPQPFAQIAATRGRLEIEGVTSEFPALFRSTTGSLDNPRPYAQDTTAALAVTADDVTLTRQEDGTFLGRTTVTVHNGGDAAHDGLGVSLTYPAVLDWPDTDPAEPCGLDSTDVPGSNAVGCYFDGRLAEGQSRTFDWIFRAPADAPVGPAGTATTRVTLENPGAPQTDGADTVAFQITIAD